MEFPGDFLETEKVANSEPKGNRTNVFNALKSNGYFYHWSLDLGAAIAY
jgi:hypothetical protein